MRRIIHPAHALIVPLLAVATSCYDTRSTSETVPTADTVVVETTVPAEPVVTEPAITEPPATDAPAPVCAPTPVAGVQDMLVADAEAYSNTLAASAAANFEPVSGGLGCALPASGISGANAPDAAATPGAISALGSPVSTKAGETIMGFAVLDTAGYCGLRVIVVQNDVPTPYTVTSQPSLCTAYEAIDGFEAGEFAAIGG